MEWSIHEIVKVTGTTSRTLRHYGQIGLLKPSRTGHGGLRYYNEDALIRLQRILLLRGLGVSLGAIADVLAGEQDVTDALRTHLAFLEQERNLVERRINAVRGTIEKKEGSGQLMVEEMFDGFDHTQYKQEVQQRWGEDAYAAGDRWWRGMTLEERQEWLARSAQLSADWATAAGRKLAPDSDEAQALARRHIQWLGTASGNGSAPPSKEYVVGLGDMYVTDDRFGANYGGADGAGFVRDALAAYAERHL